MMVAKPILTFMQKISRGWNDKSIVFFGDKSWCFFNVITADPTPVLPLQWWETASDVKLFHALPTVWIWHHLTSSFSELSKNISKAIISHVIKSSSCYRKIVSRTAWRILQQNRTEKLVQHSWCYIIWGETVEKWGTETKVHTLNHIVCFVSLRHLLWE